MNYEALGKRLRAERNKLNWTQEVLAEKVDLSDAYIGQIERAERNLSLDTLVRMANELGVTVDYLLLDSIDMSDDQFLNQIKQLMHDRSSKEKQMALDLLKITFAHIDDMK